MPRSGPQTWNGASSVRGLGPGGAHSSSGDWDASPGPLPILGDQQLPQRWRREEQEAQQMVCELLIQSCERALYDLRCSLGQAEAATDVRTGLRAADLLATVLVGWRETLRLLNGR